MRKARFAVVLAAGILLAGSLAIFGQARRRPQQRPPAPAVQATPEPSPTPTPLQTPAEESLKIDTNLVTIPIVVMDRGIL